MVHVRGGGCVVTITHLSYKNSYVLTNFLPHADAVQSHSKPHIFCGSQVFLNDAFPGTDPILKQHFVAFTALLNL